MLLLTVVGCDYASDNRPDSMSVDSWFEFKIGDRQILAQLAISLPEKQKGLMFRKALEQDSGMLFVYQNPQKVSFWMKNTPLPLDLGLFDASGTLREIHRLIPYDTTSVHSNSDEIQYALEMHQGWFARNNLFPGTKLDLASVVSALKARGKNPRTFGISGK